MYIWYSIVSWVYKPTNITGGAPPCMFDMFDFVGAPEKRISHLSHQLIVD